MTENNIKNIAIKAVSIIYMVVLTGFVAYYISKIFEEELWDNERVSITAFIAISLIVSLGYLAFIEKKILKLLFSYHFIVLGTAICSLIPIKFMPFVAIPMIITIVYSVQAGIVTAVSVSVTLMMGMGEYPLYFLSGAIVVVAVVSCFAVARTHSIIKRIAGIMAFLGTELMFLIYFKNYCYELGTEYEEGSFIVKMMVTAIITVVVGNALRIVYDMFITKNTPDVMLKKISADNSEAVVMMKNKSTSLYYHSIEVAEMSRLAAKRIGANFNLAYAGGLFHDLGKLHGSEYIKEGLKLADKFGIPKDVKTIMVEHNVKSRLPKSKESAIVMLCDTAISSIEYVKGTMDKKDVSENVVVENALNKRLLTGALRKSNLTIEEFEIIKETLMHIKEQ